MVWKGAFKKTFAGGGSWCLIGLEYVSKNRGLSRKGWPSKKLGGPFAS